MAKATSAAVNGPLWGARARDWADVQEGTARAAFTAVMNRLAAPGVILLDAGCGSGMAAQIAASKGARVSGIDAAEPLLEIARERAPQGDFRHGDLEALPFEDNRFDVVTGFNAFQYAADPVHALQEVRRVLRRQGTAAIVVWGDPAAMPMASVIRALGPLLPPPPPGAPGPFALSDRAALRKLAEEAGLAPRTVFDVEDVITYPDLPTALRGLASSGVAARAMAASGEEAVNAAHAAALAPFLTADGSYRIGASFRCLLADA